VASHSALSEEGRTRIRYFQGRFYSYVILWILIGLGVVIGAIWLRTRYGYLPLQRLYLAQYIKSSLKSFLPRKRSSNYILLVRVISDSATGRDVVIPCTDQEVTPVRDEMGRVKFDPNLGPFFRLREDVRHKYFYWKVEPQNDIQMNSWLRNQIYDGHSLIGLYWLCFTPLPLIVFVGMIASVKLDVRINREYEEGNLVRGIRSLKHSEYSKETKGVDGLGLPVFRPERTQQ
jgi:hypothetical protein